MNFFATILTNVAPSANYRGESEQNRSVLQRVSLGRFEYAVISPEAMRNALREILCGYGLACNRTRLPDEKELAVEFKDYPYPERYVDDFFFGYLVADRKQVPDRVRAERDGEFQFKRDSILRMNLALALEPYRHDALFTQSPLTVKNAAAPWQNATTSALLHRDTTVTAYQYPVAINLDDCLLEDDRPPVDGVLTPGGEQYLSRGEQHADWLRHLLRSLSELSDAAGNHARSLYQMQPASIVIRLTNSLVSEYDLYAFQRDGSLPEVVDGILEGDYPGREFHLGGELVRRVLSEDQRRDLAERGVRLHRMGRDALNAAAAAITGRGFLLAPVEGSE